MIESVNNERIKQISKLNIKKYQDEENLFLVEGEHLVEEASISGYLKEVFILDGYDFDYPVKTIVSENVMRKLTTLTTVPRIIGVVSKLKQGSIKGKVLLLDGVQDPGNLGTIIRSSVAFNADTLVLGTGTVSLYNPKVLRASEGLVFHQNIIEMPIEEIIPELKSEGYTIYSTDVTNGKLLNEIDFPEKCAIIMGSEGSGVRQEIKDMCDEYLYIPINKTCESLNVSIATSIILYQMNK